MGKRFPEYKGLDLSKVNKEILRIWDENDTFNKSIREVDGKGDSYFTRVRLQQTESLVFTMLWPVP